MQARLAAVVAMDVITVRVQERISKVIELLSRDKNKKKADVIRELMTKAVEEEELGFYLKKYQSKEMTLRQLAKKLNLPLWKAYELASGVEFPYSKTDLQRDLTLVGEA